MIEEKKLVCWSCKVAFKDSELHRDHYKSDFHLYNLKRKLVNLAPVTLEKFNQKVNELKPKVPDSVIELRCHGCRKNFSSQKAFSNHQNSKKHLNFSSNQSENQSVSKVLQKSTYDVEVDDEAGSDWESVDDDYIGIEECLFCDEKKQTMEENLEHMSVTHGFFIPDLEYVTDLEGLLAYLSTKVGTDYACLWCSENGKSFASLLAVRRHMLDKGHAKVKFDPDLALEYSDFYDYSASYPDASEHGYDGADLPISSITKNLMSMNNDANPYELKLPSGKVIGHRSLMRYYNQNLYRSSLTTSEEERSKRQKALTSAQRIAVHYRGLGWTSGVGNEMSRADAAAMNQRAKDFNVLRRLKMKWWQQLGVANNRLQKHFRKQTGF